jgi:hypothetical protein
MIKKFKSMDFNISHFLLHYKHHDTKRNNTHHNDSIITLNIIALGIMTLSFMTLGIMEYITTLRTTLICCYAVSKC